MAATVSPVLLGLVPWRPCLLLVPLCVARFPERAASGCLAAHLQHRMCACISSLRQSGRRRGARVWGVAAGLLICHWRPRWFFTCARRLENGGLLHGQHPSPAWQAWPLSFRAMCCNCGVCLVTRLRQGGRVCWTPPCTQFAHAMPKGCTPLWVTWRSNMASGAQWLSSLNHKLLDLLQAFLSRQQQQHRTDRSLCCCIFPSQQSLRQLVVQLRACPKSMR